MEGFVNSFGAVRILGWLSFILLLCVVLFLFRNNYLNRKHNEVTWEVLKEHGDNPFEHASAIASEVERRVKESLFFANIKYSLIALVAFVTSAYIAFFSFRLPISSSPAEWGQMGDFFGGMLNPILAFASFIALLYTIRIQSEELRLTRRELEQSVRAQAEIAKTAREQLSQTSLMEDYRYVASKLRSESERCNTIMNTPFVVSVTFIDEGAELSASSIYDVLVLLSFQFGVSSSEGTGSAEESFNKARAWLLEKIDKDSLREMLFHLRGFLSNSRALNQVVSLYSKICKELRIAGGPESVSELDINEATRILAQAYMLSAIFKNYSPGAFTPEPPAARKGFLVFLTNWGLNLELDTPNN